MSLSTGQSNRLSWIISLFLGCLLSSIPASAQRQISQNQDGFESNLYEGNLNATPERDSTVIQRTVPKDYTQWVMNPTTGLMDALEPDTLQYLFQNSGKNEGNRMSYNHLANIGSPRISRLFDERDAVRFFLFDVPYSHFLKNPTEFRFTDTKTPHLNLTYFSGGDKRNGDDHIKGYFAANFGKKVGIGFDMDYIYGRGRYSNQNTSLYDARVYGYFHGDVYQAHLSFNTDYIKVAENRGIEDDQYITHPEMMAEGRKEYNPEEIPVRMNNNWNNLDRKQFLLAQSLILRSSYQRTDSIGDTIMTRTLFKEVGTVANTTEFGFLKRRFISYSEPSNFYSRNLLVNDSVDSFRNFYLDNTVSFNLNEGFSKWAVAGLRLFARYELRSYTMADTLTEGRSSEYQRRENEYDIFIGGSIQRETGKNLNLGVRAQTAIVGNNFGDFGIEGNLGLNFNLMKQAAALSAKVRMAGTTPDYYLRHYHSQHYWWDSSLDKEISLNAQGELRIDRWHTRLTAGITNLNNYAYLVDDGTTDAKDRVLSDIRIRQESSAIQVINATLNQDFILGPLHWDNSVTWQYSSNATALPLPTLNVFTDLYFKFLYAKRMEIEVGADATWFTEYYAPDYSPATGQFHIQNELNKVKVGNYPIIDVYLNCVLRGVRFYVMLSHVNSGMSGNGLGGPFLVPHYPVNPRMFRFGLSWTFFD